VDFEVKEEGINAHATSIDFAVVNDLRKTVKKNFACN